MAQQPINVGTQAFADSDNIRQAFQKVNSNTSELYGFTGAITRLFTAANDAARTALSGLRSGDYVNQTDDNTFWVWNGSSWIRKNGRVYEPVDAAALASVTGMVVLDFAQLQDTGAWYLFDGSAWQVITTDGGGGGGSAGDEIETGATFTKVSTSEVVGQATVDVRDSAGTGAYRAAAFSHNAAFAAVGLPGSVTAGFEAKEDFLGITDLDAVGVVAEDTSGAQPIKAYNYAGDGRGAAGNQHESTIGVLDQNNGHLADWKAGRSGAGLLLLAARVLRGSGSSFGLVMGPDGYTMNMTNEGQTSQLAATPTQLLWTKEARLSAYPSTRNDGSTVKALYVDASGVLKYGAVSVSQLTDSGTAAAGFTAVDTWTVALAGAGQSQLTNTDLNLTGVDLNLLTNSKGVIFKTQTGVTARLNLVDDLSAPQDDIRLELTLIV